MNCKEAMDLADRLKVGESPEAQALVDKLKKSIGFCVECTGLGKKVYFTIQTAGTGYREVKSNNGSLRYVKDCSACKGSGQILEKNCISCGVHFIPEAFIDCYTRMVENGLCEKCFVLLNEKIGISLVEERVMTIDLAKPGAERTVAQPVVQDKKKGKR